MTRNWALYLFILFPVLIFSQKQSREIVNKKDSILPGTASSISFSLENTTSQNKVYDIVIETSNQYIIPILKKNQVSIAGDETYLYLVPLRIATETPQGKYTITLRGLGSDKTDQFIKTAEINVLPVRKLSVTAINSPEFVKAGETITSSFLLKNSGNVTEKLILESKNAVVNHDATLLLPPGEAKVINISKVTNPDLGKNEYQNLNLSVYSVDHPAETQTAYSSTKIISVKPGEDDIYHRLPVSASMAFIGMKNRGEYHDGFQGELYGKGTLDKENKGTLEFHAVTSNPVEFNSFTQYEEYFINYRRDEFFVHLGDKTYSSSYLTEYARYGRGAEIRYNFKKISIGGFYNHPRFFRDIKDEFNVYSTFRLHKESEITAGYLYKIPRPGETSLSFSGLRLDSNAHLPYATGKFKLNKNLDVSGEVAYSKTDRMEGNAYMVQLLASYTKINGNLMYMKSSPDFAGYFSNTSTFNGNIQYKISSRLNAFANYVQDARNFQRDTLFLAAPYRNYFQYGISYRYLKNGSIMLYNGYQKYKDRLEPRQFDYYERFVRVSIDQQIGIFQVNLQGQFGKTDNYLSGFNGNSSFYTVNLAFEKLKTSFNVFGSYAITSRYQLQDQEQIYYGARVISRFSPKTNLSIFYQNNYIPEEYFNDRNLFEVLFHQQIFPGHEFDVSGRYALQRGQLGNKDFIFSLRYTWRLNMPVQKTAEYTTLSGNIGNLGVKKVEGIRLTMGNHLSITDKNGNFIFKNINPGDYILEIDRSTTDINDIPDISLPATVLLTNKENIFNFGLTTAAAIQGVIQFKETTDPNQLSFAQFQLKKEKKRKESIIIEASNGDQTYRKIAYIGENFDFNYLRPGDWDIKLYRNGLDKRYKISMDAFHFTLHPSETKSLVIDVVKQQTEIKYQKESIKVGYNTIKKQK
ncbi:COG1470 family protein [Chryseobacterium proteolyticum]|uniref:COG1470 family protein n=1 Tax=Chryseobacterium proteolyticum TaxID=118127 RepID=UPI003983B02B